MMQSQASHEFRLTWNSLLPPLLLILLCLLLQLWPGAETLRYERSLLADQPWRLITGHLVHLDFLHLLMNAVGTVLLWLLFADILPRRLAVSIIIVSATGISSALYLLNPEVEWYVGLSGILYGYAAAGSLYGVFASPQRRKLYALLLAGVLLKAGLDEFSGNSLSDALFDANVITRAHLYGIICSLLLALVSIIFTHLNRQQQRQG